MSIIWLRHSAEHLRACVFDSRDPTTSGRMWRRCFWVFHHSASLPKVLCFTFYPKYMPWDDLPWVSSNHLCLVNALHPTSVQWYPFDLSIFLDAYDRRSRVGTEHRAWRKHRWASWEEIVASETRLSVSGLHVHLLYLMDVLS